MVAVGSTLTIFNSHPHKEDDEHYTVLRIVSTFFNSHPHKEDDLPVVLKASAFDVFQLTSSQGG